MKHLIVLAASLAILTATGLGCGKRPEDNPEFKAETAKEPLKIANPAEGLTPGGPGMGAPPAGAPGMGGPNP